MMKDDKKNICLGLLAHVDAGKTTLSEALLYTTGQIRKQGRVDDETAFLDNDAMEKERGITIYSKQAVIDMEDCVISLIDTPGHVDFSAEMERTLNILDYAILVVSGTDGVQSHTETLWQLFDRYEVPVFIFINKMDRPDTNRENIMTQLKGELSDNCVFFDAGTENEEYFEEIAMCGEEVMDYYLENGTVSDNIIKDLIYERKLFPCFFGSALKCEGISGFIDGLLKYTKSPDYGEEFGARVYKISHDEHGNRLTHIKVTGGSISVKDLIDGEKVNAIRIYSGGKYEAVSSVCAGRVCCLSGITKAYPGDCLGAETGTMLPGLEPLLTYNVLLKGGDDALTALGKLRQLEEEEPELSVVWDEDLKEIHLRIMGRVQLEIIKHELESRFGLRVDFGAGKILYKETIVDKVVGVGHFEPLRHYAEVHLLMEPGEPGSGLVFDTVCSEDMLAKNWQRLILTHLEERKHKGVLTGSYITDMKISILAGKAHTKHTEGGDFRQATYRAVRQGLRGATSVLLEPYFSYCIKLPEGFLGRAITDIQKMSGTINPPEQSDGVAVVSGICPVATMWEYGSELAAYTGGRGKISLSVCGYYPCHNTEEVIAKTGYDVDEDFRNTADSVFCSHGSGYVVPWYEVPQKAHIQTEYVSHEFIPDIKTPVKKQSEKNYYSIGIEEIESIISGVGGGNKKTTSKRHGWERRGKKKIIQAPSVRKSSKAPEKEKDKYLLVDGYNIVFAWPELKKLAEENIDSARLKLMDIMCNYQGYKGINVIVVFDAYRVKGSLGTMQKYHNINVVYTGEAETADEYIEKLTHRIGEKNDIMVATSDNIIQLIIMSQGCHPMSANGLFEEVSYVEKQISESLFFNI